MFLPYRTGSLTRPNQHLPYYCRAVYHFTRISHHLTGWTPGTSKLIKDIQPSSNCILSTTNFHILRFKSFFSLCLSVEGQQPAENRRAESLRPSQNPKCSSKAWSYTCVYWITSTKLETWKQNWLKQSLTEKIPLRHFPNLPAVFLLLPFSLALFEAKKKNKKTIC